MNIRSRVSLATLGILALMPFSLAETFPLEKLDLSLMSTEWGQPRAKRSSSNNAIRIGGETFKSGVGTHANSTLLLKLDGNGDRFTAKVGVDDEVGKAGSVTFRLIGDDKELFNSGVMRGGDKAKSVDIDISGVKQLKLVADDAKDGNNSDHANWADAQIVMKSGSPVALPDGNFINIVSGASQLLLRIDAKGNLFQQYLGNSNAGNSVYTGGAKKDQAYPVINSNKEFQYWNDPALLIIHADGKNSNAFAYVSHETKTVKEGITLTRILLKDRFYPVELTLCYQAYAQESIIEQWAEVKNNESGLITLRQIDSAAIPFSAGKYWLTHFAGRWAGEFDVHEEQLAKGTRLVDSKCGITSSMIHEPHFLISLDAPSTENSGRVLGASLAWSGNFRLSFEIDQDNRLYAHAGINPYLSAYPLDPGKTFRTPELIWTYSDKGRGEISRRFSRWARAERIKGGDQTGYVILNNWEATGFDVSEKRILPQFPGGQEIGTELFLLDDGWFGTPQKSRTLGDWDVSTKILPNGLEPLIKGCADQNMKFGYWVEMEMANPEAKVVADHPDWILADRNREDYLQRGQWVLDMSRPEVQDFAFDAFDKSLVDHPGVRYVKWDCNSSFHNPWSTYLGAQKQERLWVDYTHGLYNVMALIAAKHPDIPMMACSGGGGRVDYGTMRYFNEFWASDNTDPLRRVKIQWGYSHFFPAKSISAHVTHWGHRPFKFAFDVAMSGRLGMDLDMLKLSDEEKFWAKQSIDLYKKRLRPVVQFGDLYRLESPYEGARASLLYTKGNSAVVFAYQVQDNTDTAKQPLKLAGLDTSRRYKVEEVNLPANTASTCPQHGKTLTGASLMNDGLTLSLTKTLQSSVFVITAE